MTVSGRPEDASARVDLALERDFRLGSMRVSPSGREVRLDDGREQLEPRVMQVLVRLARTPGTVVSRDALIQSCWEGRIVGEDAINRVIARLRRLSELDEGASFTIETIPRVGYRLWPAETEVEAPAPPEQPAGVPEAELAEARSLPPRPPGPPTGGPRPTSLRKRWPVLAMAMVAAVVGGGAFYTSRAVVGLPREQVTALAVLPFDDMSSKRDHAYFAEGVAEEIQGALAAEPGLRVIGRTSARSFKDEPDFQRLRRDLKVSHVLEGSVRSEAGQLRMTVRLVRTNDGSQVWAEEFQRPAADVFAVQDEVSDSVARSLRGRFVLPGRRSEEPRTEVQAYDLVLAARARLRETRPADLIAARNLVRRAVEIDPSYGPAWAVLSEVTRRSRNQLGGGGRLPANKAEAEALGYARRAVRLAPDDPSSHGALAAVTDPEEALDHIRHAVRLDPSSAELRVRHATVLSKLGRHGEAVDQLKAATQLDPLYRVSYLVLADNLSRLGRFADAEAVAVRYASLHDRPVEAAMLRASLAADRGDWSETVRLIEWAHGQDGAYSRADLLGLAYRVLNLRERAAALSKLTAQPFDAAVYARDDRRALTLIDVDPDSVWEPSRAPIAADVLLRSKRAAVLVQVLQTRYGGAEGYCRSGRDEAAPEFAQALLDLGRDREAAVIVDCAERRVRAERALGFDRGRYGVVLAQLAAMSGRPSQAMRDLERAYADGFRGQFYTAELTEMPGLARLAGEPRFEVIRQRLAGHVQKERQEVLKLGPPPQPRVQPT